LGPAVSVTGQDHETLKDREARKARDGRHAGAGDWSAGSEPHPTTVMLAAATVRARASAGRLSAGCYGGWRPCIELGFRAASQVL